MTFTAAKFTKVRGLLINVKIKMAQPKFLFRGDKKVLFLHFFFIQALFSTTTQQKMEKSFGNLLRHSRLASYDRSLPQVYKTTKHRKRIGDYGLKRNLPSVIKTPHLTIGALDTAEHQTPWESGQSKVLFLKRWKENFPNSKKPAPRPEVEHYNLASMTPAEFQRFLRQVKKQNKATSFQEALQKKEVVADQVFDYLNVNFNTTQLDGGEEGRGIVGPIYSDYQVGWDYPVQGRILNADRQGHAIGIGGIVAALPRRNAIGLTMGGDRMVRTFYVKHAELDLETGRPKVEVTIRARGAASSIPLLNNYETYDTFENGDGELKLDFTPHRFGRGGQGGKNKKDFNNRSRSTQQGQGQAQQQPEIEDNITPNPEHTELMARISDLLNNSKERK